MSDSSKPNLINLPTVTLIVGFKASLKHCILPLDWQSSTRQVRYIRTGLVTASNQVVWTFLCLYIATLLALINSNPLTTQASHIVNSWLLLGIYDQFHQNVAQIAASCDHLYHTDKDRHQRGCSALMSKGFLQNHLSSSLELFLLTFPSAQWQGMR
jgi:hypothetical protein